jgi:hypothetical protein
MLGDDKVLKAQGCTNNPFIPSAYSSKLLSCLRDERGKFLCYHSDLPRTLRFQPYEVRITLSLINLHFRKRHPILVRITRVFLV